MPPQEQADLWMALRDRMKVDWNEMTLQEKKAGMSTLYTSFVRSKMVAKEYRRKAGRARDSHNSTL